MVNVIVELSKFVILTLMVVYTFHCFYMVKQQSEEERNESLRQQLMLIFFMDFTAFLVIYLKTGKFQVVTFYAEMMVFFAGIQILYRMLYKKASILLLNNMCMLLSVGFIILCRLDVATATRQLIIVTAVNLVALAVPVLIRKMKFLKDLTWLYAGVGILLLGAVLVTCPYQLWSQAVSDGNPAFRGHQDHICIFYGCFASQRGRFQNGSSGYDRGRTSCRNSGAFP